jgi:methionine biosynthesis protein MetW
MRYWLVRQIVRSSRNAKRKLYDDVYCRRKISYEPSQGLMAYLYKRFSRFNVNRYQVAYDLLPFGDKLLDVGCGDGFFALMARKKFKKCYGVDVSPMRIEEAIKRTQQFTSEEVFYFYEHDVDEGLPFDDSFFDAIACIAVLEHVFNPPNVLDEMRRVLKSGGILVVQVPNFAWIPSRIQLLFGKLPTTGGTYLGTDWEHLHNFTDSMLRRLLVNKGFEIEDVQCSGIFAKYRRLWFSALAGDLLVKAKKVVNTDQQDK